MMNLQEIQAIRLAKQTRAAQVRYFRTRNAKDLETAKKLERQLDQALLNVDENRQPEHIQAEINMPDKQPEKEPVEDEDNPDIDHILTEEDFDHLNQYETKTDES